MPQAITYNPNNQIYVANTFSVIKPVADNNNLISTIPQDILLGDGTAGLPYNSNDGKIYVTNLDSDTISMIDGSTDKIIDTIPVGIGQMELPMILKMEEYAWPICFSSDIYILDGSNNNVVASIPSDTHPHGVFHNPAKVKFKPKMNNSFLCTREVLI